MLGCTGSLSLHSSHPHHFQEKLILSSSSTISRFKKCGMRHPTSGLSEDDLSRLTGSSTTASTPSQENDHHHRHHHQHHHHDNKGCSIIPILNDNETINNIKNSHNFASSYLPEIIDPLEWQKSRKRKERQDSTSSITQDRKLVRSNSEELISSSDYEVIRRVSSHEDFKKPLQEINDEKILKAIQENDINASSNDLNCVDCKNVNENDHNHHQQCHQQQQQQQNNVQNPGGISFMVRSRIETSPARSHRLSPSREYRSNFYNHINNNNNHNGKYKDNDDSDWEQHERRRSSERFCKSRAPPGRKSGIIKKSSRYSSSRYRDRDDNVYKYDISSMKHERRGFVSKFKLDEKNRKEEISEVVDQQKPLSDYNDNNLIDFRIGNNELVNENQENQPLLLKSPVSAQQNQEQFPIKQQHEQQQPQVRSTISKFGKELPQTDLSKVTVAEALPWDCSTSEEQTPVLCRRFAEMDDEYMKENGKPGLFALPSAVDDTDEPPRRSSFHSFANTENLKSREIMPSLPSLGMFQTPEERLKQINKKLTALKKRVAQLEENFEKNCGYRPSQIEKYNDKQIKNVLTEISKLRKEKHELKSDPMAALGLRVSGGMDAEKKVTKMKETLVEIEKKLDEKRKDGCRLLDLDSLTPDQLVAEKTAVQHGLLYLESLYGRPTTRDERDAVRPLYDRYRTIKRMVSRSISISGAGIGVSELPTILEHEAMAFTVDSFPSTAGVSRCSFSASDAVTSPDGINAPTSSPIPTAAVYNYDSAHSPTNDDSQNSSVSTTPDHQQSQQQFLDEIREDNFSQEEHDHQYQQQNPSLGENVHTLSVDELWAQLEKVREEKKQLKRNIREYEMIFEEQNGRKMLKADRKAIEDTYAHYKEKKAKFRLLQALIKKHISN